MALLSLPFPAGAQTSLKDKALRIVHKLTAPSKKLDSAYVFQRRAHWNVALTSGIMQNQVWQTSIFNLTEDNQPFEFNAHLHEGLYKQVGLKAGYGGLVLGYSHEIGFKSALKRKSFVLDMLKPGWGLQIQYFNIQDIIDYTMKQGVEGEVDFAQLSGQTDSPGTMRFVVADAVYAFNQAKFVLNGAYSSAKLQRRSAGSFILTGKFNIGEVSFKPDDDFSEAANLILSTSSTQVSVGGGYSYNLVPYHRDPDGPGEKGLRNLTLNLTVAPVLTLYNKMVFNDGDSALPMIGRVSPNYTSRVGVGYAFGRFGMNLSGKYDILAYASSRPVDTGDPDIGPVSTRALFSKWQVSFLFTVQL